MPTIPHYWKHFIQPVEKISFVWFHQYIYFTLIEIPLNYRIFLNYAKRKTILKDDKALESFKVINEYY